MMTRLRRAPIWLIVVGVLPSSVAIEMWDVLVHILSETPAWYIEFMWYLLSGGIVISFIGVVTLGVMNVQPCLGLWMRWRERGRKEIESYPLYERDEE